MKDESKSWATSIESACHLWLTCWEIWQWRRCLQLLLLILYKMWRRHWLSHLQNKVSHHYACSTGREYTGNKNPRWYLKYSRLDPQHLALDSIEVTCTCFWFSALYDRFYRRSHLQPFLMSAFLTCIEIMHWFLKTVMPD